MNLPYLILLGERHDFDPVPFLVVVLFAVIVIIAALVYIFWPATPKRTVKCWYCWVETTDWVEPDWAPDRICRKCETEHEPT